MNDENVDFIEEWFSRKMKDDKLNSELVSLIYDCKSGDEINEDVLFKSLIVYAEELENKNETN
jgi:hypothetical protein